MHSHPAGQHVWFLVGKSANTTIQRKTILILVALNFDKSSLVADPGIIYQAGPQSMTTSLLSLRGKFWRNQYHWNHNTSSDKENSEFSDAETKYHDIILQCQRLTIRLNGFFKFFIFFFLNDLNFNSKSLLAGLSEHLNSQDSMSAHGFCFGSLYRNLKYRSAPILEYCYCFIHKCLFSCYCVKKLFLFVLRLNVPVNNFSVMSGRSHRFLGN